MFVWLWAPIELLRKKAKSNDKIIWEENHQDIMDKLYKILDSELMLVYPNFEIRMGLTIFYFRFKFY
jgi:hypothetical protein